MQESSKQVAEEAERAHIKERSVYSGCDLPIDCTEGKSAEQSAFMGRFQNQIVRAGRAGFLT